MKEEAPIGKPFYRSAKGWPAHVANVPPLCTKVVVVEPKRMLVEKKVEKEGVGGWPATHFGWPAKPWPPLSLLAVLKPNRLICKRTDANCRNFYLRVFLGLLNPQEQRQTSILSIPRDNLRK
jgi:hypothetical protein